MMSSDAKKPHGPGGGGGVALTPSMGAMSRSYSARSGGLVNELCLLGRDEVPSLVGDMVLLTKLVMLWQLLEREGQRLTRAQAGQAGTHFSLLSAPVPGKAAGGRTAGPGPASLQAVPLLLPFR